MCLEWLPAHRFCHMTFEPSPTAREMADALRAGVSARLRDHDAATPEEDLARFRALGALEDVAPVAKPTVVSPLVRGLRGLLRGLLRPWLAAQTRFNREIADTSVQTATSAHALSRRLSALEASLHVLQTQLRRWEEQPRVGGAETPMPSPDAVTLLRMIVQSRIRRPPARVLVCGCDVIARDLAAFGFDVVPHVASGSPATDDTPGQTDSACATAARREAPLGCVIRVDAAAGEVNVEHHEHASAHPSSPALRLASVLEPGGQAILCVTNTATDLAAALEGLVPQAIVTAHRDAHEWTVREHPAGAERSVTSAAPGVLTVIVAERPHASGR